jgi:uracil-DNA glycosylase
MRDHAGELRALQQRIMRSRVCPRLREYCRQVAHEKRARFRNEEYWGRALASFGDPRAELLIVGLAPAAHGGNRTGRMFTGDRSGDFLFRALYEAGFANQPASLHRGDGLELRNCYITAAVRWAPPGNKPTPEEIRACLPFLEEELRLLERVRAILALGRIAFDACLSVARHGRPDFPRKSSFPFAHGANFALPFGLPRSAPPSAGLRLFCSYHPSQQNTQTGKLTPAMFRAVLRDIRRHLAQ